MKSGIIVFFPIVYLFIALFFLLCPYSFANECEQGLQSHSEWLWCDDFESSDTNLNSRYQDVSTNGLSITGDKAFEGSHCLRQHYTQGQIDAGWICRVQSSFPDHIFMRWYHAFEPGFEGFPEKMARIRYRNRNTWTSSYAVHCWLERDGILALDVSAQNSSQANDVGWLPIARSGFSFANSAIVGRWICFEMEVMLNSPGNKDGLYRLWADDSLLIERTGVDLRGSTSEKINEAMLDCYWNEGSPKPQNRYYDNFIISTQKIGRFTGAFNSINKPSGPASESNNNNPSIEIIYGKLSTLPDVALCCEPGTVVVSMYDCAGKTIGVSVNLNNPTGKLRLSLQRIYSRKDNEAKGMRILHISVNTKSVWRPIIVY
jgi:hypothetical protein